MSLQPGESLLGARSALILVVERNVMVQRLEEFFASQAGYEVEFANDGVAALNRIHEILPQIVVTEIMVPSLDGLSLCRVLKNDPLTKQIRVLIFSHLHAEDRAVEAGADAFLLKPFPEEILLKTVEKLIGSGATGTGYAQSGLGSHGTPGKQTV